MKERSGMPYDVIAYEADELAAALDPAEEGIFHRMLRKAWMNGSVPADLTDLAHLIHVDPRMMRRSWRKLEQMWFVDPENPSRLFNRKLESERRFLEGKRRSAQMSASMRWKDKKTNKKPNANALRPSNASPPLPIPPLPNPTIHSETVMLVLGEFGWAKMTEDQHLKLQVKLNGNLTNYIRRFDHWVNEAPDAKKDGIKRRDRHAYESISGWADRDAKENHGTPKGQPYESFAEAKIRRQREAGEQFRKSLFGAAGDSPGPGDPGE